MTSTKRSALLLVLIVACNPRHDHGHDDHGHDDHGHEHDDHRVTDEQNHAAEAAHLEITREGADAAGVRVAPLTRRALDGASRFPAEVRVEPHGVAHLAPIVAGRVERVHVRLGQSVRAGETLATLASAGVADLQTRERALEVPLRVAEAALARRTQLAAEGIGAERAVLEAEAEVSRIRAEVAGLRRQASALGARRGTVAMRAPFAGIVASLDLAVGEPASPDTPAMMLIDPTAIAVFVAIPERAVAQVVASAANDSRPRRVRFRARAIPGTFEGYITYLAPTLDPSTRTMLARITLDAGEEPGSRDDVGEGSTASARAPSRAAASGPPLAALRGGMYGEVELSPELARVLALPVEGIAHIGGVPTAFVAVEGSEDGPLLFEPRPVTLGRRADGHVEIVRGVDEGANVAHTGAFVLEGVLRAHLIPEDHDH